MPTPNTAATGPTPTTANSPATAARPRSVLLVAHTGRPDIVAAASTARKRLGRAGVELVGLTVESADLGLPPAGQPTTAELVLALGGDGTLLRAAEQARPLGIPVLGVNLGRVGFLAEADADHLDGVIQAVIDRSYTTSKRVTVDVTVTHGDRQAMTGWALNEVSLEKAIRERILDVVVKVDGRGVSAYGCDGVLVATPTGSTAYAFSAGGPILWPDVQALLVVPSNAHALFARPLVVGPDSVVTVQVDPAGHGAALTCDGRRTFQMPPGALMTARRGAAPVLLARLGTEPFTDRLVRKFSLPAHGWREQRY